MFLEEIPKMPWDPTAPAPTAGFKAAVVSADPATAGRLRALLNAAEGAQSVEVQGGVAEAARVADENRPDILFVQGTRHDGEELLALERIVARHPGMAVVMLSPNQSPDFLRQAMRVGLRDILPVPLVNDTVIDALGRVQRRLAAASSATRSATVLSFIGAKGGSGATFVAANLGYAIARNSPKRVAFIDFNRQFGDAVLYVSAVSPTSTLADVASQVHRLDGAFLTSSMLQVLPNYHVLAAPDEPEQALQIGRQHIDAVLWAARTNYDVVIVDAGRSIDDATLSVLDQSESVFLVLQRSLPYLRYAKRITTALAGLDYSRSKVKLIVNRNEKRSALTLEDISGALQHDVYRAIPNSYSAACDAANQGIPILKLFPRDPVSRALREMANALAPARKEGGWVRGLLRAPWSRDEGG